MNNHRECLLEVLSSVGPQLHAMLLRLTLSPDSAEDLIQQLFVNLDQSSGLQQADNRRAYVFQAARNLGYAWIRQHRHRTQEVPLDQAYVAPVDHQSPLDYLIEKERQLGVLNHLARLPEPGRTVVMMRYLEGREYVEIGELLSYDSHYVRNLCHRAVSRLRETVGDFKPDDLTVEKPSDV